MTEVKLQAEWSVRPCIGPTANCRTSWAGRLRSTPSSSRASASSRELWWVEFWREMPSLELLSHSARRWPASPSAHSATTRVSHGSRTSVMVNGIVAIKWHRQKECVCVWEVCAFWPMWHLHTFVWTSFPSFPRWGIGNGDISFWRKTQWVTSSQIW